MYREQLSGTTRVIVVMLQDATFSYKIHLYCFTLQEQNHVYLSVRGDLWPYKIVQIRLAPKALVCAVTNSS